MRCLLCLCREKPARHVRLFNVHVPQQVDTLLARLSARSWCVTLSSSCPVALHFQDIRHESPQPRKAHGGLLVSHGLRAPSPPRGPLHDQTIVGPMGRVAVRRLNSSVQRTIVMPARLVALASRVCPRWPCIEHSRVAALIRTSDLWAGWHTVSEVLIEASTGATPQGQRIGAPGLLRVRRATHLAYVLQRHRPTRRKRWLSTPLAATVSCMCN